MTNLKRFYGRENEIQLLQKLKEDVCVRGVSRFVAISGRWRIGKTRLINEAFPTDSEVPTISMYVASQLASTNLSNLVDEIQSALGMPYRPALRSYEEAFRLIFKEAERKPLILVLDEFQNFQSVDPTVFKTLQVLWDRHQSKSKILVVVSGSENGLREIFENEKAPLFEKANEFIHLEPFSPKILKDVLMDFKNEFKGEDLLALYSLTGGVPQYVQSFLESGSLTLDAMLKQSLSFNSSLMTEAQLIIANEFKGNASHMNEILMAIALGKNKRRELVPAFDINISGHLHQLENELGLIRQIEPWGNNGAVRKRARFELTDNLLNFWYTFCLPNRKMLQSASANELYDLIKVSYSVWLEGMLKRLYRHHFEKLGYFDEVSPWWDKSGESEIDLVAVNKSEKRIVFADIKFDADDIDLKALKTKAINFFSLNQDYLSYQQEYLGLSVKELASTGELPQIDCATYSSLEDGYRDMAADRQYNREANEWIKISGETLKDESL